ncbi:MAG: hypothetical protein HRT88_18170, partial [Lentisphaeraceae bacterium]|nr:hypothetical protein [Lentisphaeraceae bacterium]
MNDVDNSVLYFLLCSIVVLSLYKCALIVFKKRSHPSEVKRRYSAFEKEFSSLDILAQTHCYPLNTWHGYANFRVVEKHVESWIFLHGRTVSEVCSFVLKPVDTPLPLPDFKPGQHLAFEIDTPNKQLTMYYSLSDCSNGSTFRVSIKRALPRSKAPEIPAGVGSTFFHDSINENDIIKTAMPSGDFCLDVESEGAVVLV